MSINENDNVRDPLPATVLVIDDEAHVRGVITRWLIEQGHACVEVGDPEAAWQELESQNVAAVTLDITMPGCSGVELLRRIKESYPDIPVVMLTAIADPTTIIECLTHGACGYILKPFEREELLFQVSNAIAWGQDVIERRRAQADLQALNATLEERVRERTETLAETNTRLTHEIAVRQQAEEALRERESGIRAIVDTAAEGIVTFDEQGMIRSFNQAASRLFGYQPEDVVGRNVSMLLSPTEDHDSDDNLPHQLGVGLGHVTQSSGELEAVRSDGAVFAIQWTVSAFESGGQRLFTGIIRDLTEQKLLQCELAQSQKLESVGRLAAGIAHEINTPIQYVGDNTRFLRDAFDDMNAVLNKFQDLLQPAKDQAFATDLVANIENAIRQADLDYLSKECPQAIEQSLDGVDRVASIVRAMKEFSHPGSDEKTPVDLSEAIQTTITVARNEWKYVAEMETDFDPELPSVPCLPGELNQAILNLIVNAAHAIASELGNNPTDKGTITVGTRRQGDSAEIFVRDTGGGIPEHLRSRIFDPFFTTKEVGKGTGQGLAITRSVAVDKHGGTIDFETATGKGTTFYIHLPLFYSPLNDAVETDEETHSVC